jgi:hypothetical protein
MESRLSSYTVVIALLLGLAPLSAGLADQPDDAEAERCILINRIRNTYVLDDQRILFYMRGKEVYLNQLPRRCAGLGLERRFMYRTSLSQLCNLRPREVSAGYRGRRRRTEKCGTAEARG